MITIDLDIEQLKENFNYWKLALRYYKQYPTSWEKYKNIPVTHTGGTNRVIIDDDGNEKEITIEKIIFQDKALLSAFAKMDNYPWYKEDFKRIPEIDKKLGLHHYVYAYFGTHDPYYVNRYCDFYVPAFGVFLELNEKSTFQQLNSTRRDLSVEFINEKTITLEIKRQFLMPSDSIELSLLQAYNDNIHNKSFEHYFGSVDNFSKMDYKISSWSWKSEFHYLNKVDCNDFSAILLPVSRKPRDKESNPYQVDLDLIERISESYPSLSVLPYNFNPSNFYNDYIKKSYDYAIYFAINKRWPDQNKILKEFLD